MSGWVCCFLNSLLTQPRVPLSSCWLHLPAMESSQAPGNQTSFPFPIAQNNLSVITQGIPVIISSYSDQSWPLSFRSVWNRDIKFPLEYLQYMSHHPSAVGIVLHMPHTVWTVEAVVFGHLYLISESVNRTWHKCCRTVKSLSFYFLFILIRVNEFLTFTSERSCFAKKEKKLSEATQHILAL